MVIKIRNIRIPGNQREGHQDTSGSAMTNNLMSWYADIHNLIFWSPDKLTKGSGNADY